MKLSIQNSAASAATFALLTTGAFAAQQDVTFQVSALTSSNEAAVGVPVSIETSQETLGLYSDGEGRTEGALLPGGTATTITLHEAFVSGGKLLGQRWNKDMPYSSGPDELYLLEHEHAQPLGIPRVLNRPRRMTTPRGHSRWEIGTPAVVDWRAPNVPFQAHVASLLTSREIEAYFQYQAPGVAPQGGTVGLCI